MRSPERLITAIEGTSRRQRRWSIFGKGFLRVIFITMVFYLLIFFLSCIMTAKNPSNPDEGHTVTTIEIEIIVFYSFTAALMLYVGLTLIKMLRVNYGRDFKSPRSLIQVIVTVFLASFLFNIGYYLYLFLYPDPQRFAWLMLYVQILVGEIIPLLVVLAKHHYYMKRGLFSLFRVSNTISRETEWDTLTADDPFSSDSHLPKVEINRPTTVGFDVMSS